MSRRIAIHPQSPQKRLIDQAVEGLKAGQLVVYPTDSGYAFGFTLDSRDALERVVRLRQLKPRHNFTLACRDLKHVGQYARLDDAAFRMIRSHVPGAYTFILPASSLVPKRVATEKRRSIGVRVPGNLVAQALIEALGEPILSSSLLLPDRELHGMEVDELYDALDPHVDLFIDGGPCGFDPTTVVSLIDQPYTVLRYGSGPVDWE
ncbi:MAG: L-threonylcarbamoyladenylate synthase [Lysobacterales bacterium]